MNENQVVTRPKLTFSKDVAEYVLESYRTARVILEYGSGGSTVAASEMVEKQITSVESDLAWAQNLRKYLQGSPMTLSMPEIVYADIGPTQIWGHPASTSYYRRFPAYSFGVWAKNVELAPDVVLIDGRFRVACFYATALMARQPVRVLFDDYGDRPEYHVVEQVCPLAERIGRMAIFDIKPAMVSPRLFLSIIESSLNPN